MAIEGRRPLLYWNYYLALEADLAALAQYIEPSVENQNTYSIELAHQLLAAASEVDVVLKELCGAVAPGQPAGGIGDYREALGHLAEELAGMRVQVPRYELTLTPWENWKRDRSPDWWTDYNNVKHHRGEFFARANLKNVLNAVGGLFLVVILYYRSDSRCAGLVPAPVLLRAPHQLGQNRHRLDGETALDFDRT